MIKKIFSVVFLSLLWLFLSPVYVLTRVFGYKKKVGSTLLFALLSPSTWFLLLFAGKFLVEFNDDAYGLTSHKELSRIVGVEMPPYRIVDKNIDMFCSNCVDTYTLEFDNELEKRFYKKLDSNRDWDKYDDNGEVYMYKYIGGSSLNIELTLWPGKKEGLLYVRDY